MEPKIKFRQVNHSSTVDGVAYDEKTRILSVRFKTSDIYQYADVPPDMAKAFESSKSMGGFIHKYLTKGKKKVRKL